MSPLTAADPKNWAVIERVEALQPELQRFSLADPKIFSESQIEIDHPGPEKKRREDEPGVPKVFD